MGGKCDFGYLPVEARCCGVVFVSVGSGQSPASG